jgi:hypothetical protein
MLKTLKNCSNIGAYSIHFDILACHLQIDADSDYHFDADPDPNLDPTFNLNYLMLTLISQHKLALYARNTIFTL